MLRTAKKWPLWQMPRRAVILILIVDVSALLVPVFISRRVTTLDIEVALALTSLSIAYSTLARITEQARWALHAGAEPTKYQNLLGIWTFAAAAMLPPWLMALVVIVSAASEWWALRVIRPSRLYRHIYSAAGVVLAGLTVHACTGLSAWRWLGLAVAVPAYMATGMVCVMAAMLAVGQSAGLASFLRFKTHKAELCSLAIALAEIELVRLDFAMLVWLSLPAAVVLQQRLTRAKLHRSAETSQTAPMSEEAWAIAATEIVAMLPLVAVMRINSADAPAVTAVAQVQAGCDAIGYVGKDELAMLLVDCPDVNGDALAERVRVTLLKQNVVASVAVAAKPRDGQSLGDLLAICEAELVARDAVSRSPRSFRPEA